MSSIPALLDGLGGLRRDVDGADGLTVRVEGGAGVLPLVSGSNPLDQEGNLATHLIVEQLVFVISCESNKILAVEHVDYVEQFRKESQGHVENILVALNLRKLSQVRNEKSVYKG